MRGLLKSLAISIMAAFPGLFIGQTVRVPPINLSGAIGCIGFPCTNTGTIQLPSDADYTMPSTLSQPFTSASSVKFTSAVSLTATRSVIYPAGRFPIDVENATSGGQAINICGPTGACAQIPNDATHFTRVWNDGANYVTSGSPASSTTLTGDVTGSGTGTVATTIVNKSISINSTTCTLGSSCSITVGNLPVYTASGTPLSSVHAVSGYVTASGAPIEVTLSGSAAFTSSTSYSCFTGVTDATPAPPAIPVNKSSGTTFNIAADTAGGYTGTVSYFCIGN